MRDEGNLEMKRRTRRRHSTGYKTRRVNAHHKNRYSIVFFYFLHLGYIVIKAGANAAVCTALADYDTLVSANLMDGCALTAVLSRSQ